MKLFLKIFLLLLFFTQTTRAQTSHDQQLASQYFQQGEFEKAAVLYEKLFKQTSSYYYYSTYLKCLIELKEYEKAEKIIKHQVKANSQDLTYLVDWGHLCKLNEDLNKSKKIFESAIKLLIPDFNQIYELSSAFESKEEIQYAIESFLQGRSILQNDFIFSFDMASLYSKKGDKENMIKEYLNIIYFQYDMKDSVQNALQTKLSTKGDFELLRINLLRSIQKYADKWVYSEMLIWLFIQQKDFESALIQAKALDKRFKLEGGKVLELGAISADNENYEVAFKAIQFVLEMGTQSLNYLPARIELLRIRKNKIVNSVNVNNEDILTLEKDFKEFITEFGKSMQTAHTIRELAQLKAYYLHNINEAISIIEDLLIIPNLSSRFKAGCKLDLGDYYLITGELWESTLYYSQVDKEFKEDPLGHEARLRNAKLSYYNGDFQWAQAQLDILKSATSDLISNDAIQLSVLIMDNLDLDTTAEPLRMYASANLLLIQNKTDDALRVLDSIDILFPRNALADDILFTKAKIFINKGDLSKSKDLLTLITVSYPDNILADDALFMLAEIYHRKENNTEKAMQLYHNMLTKYPGSLYVVEARKRYRQLRGDMVN